MGFSRQKYCISEVTDISPGNLFCFFPGNLDSSLCFMQLTFHMVYSAYELNKQGNNIQSSHAPFSIWNQSIVLSEEAKAPHSSTLA